MSAYVAASSVPGHPEEDTCAECDVCPDCAGLGTWWSGAQGQRTFHSCPACAGDSYVHWTADNAGSVDGDR